MHELLASNPDEDRYVILPAPHDLHLGRTFVLQPDLAVYDLKRGGRDLPAHVVEILSPSTHHLDSGLKRSMYAAGVIEHYWVVDPGDVSVTAWHVVAPASLFPIDRAAHPVQPGQDPLRDPACPFDVRPGGPTNLQPDLMVFTDASVEAPIPLLVVEILSPSTRHLDIATKWLRYAAGGIER